MAADSTVNIDVILHKDQAQQSAKELDQTLNDTGKDAGNKAKESIENNVQKASEKTKELVTNINRWVDEKGQIHIDVDKQRADESIEEFKERIKRVPKNPKIKPEADTDLANEKIDGLQKKVTKIPKEVRTELIAQAKSRGIENFDKLLRQLPKEQKTELVAKVQKGEVINYEEELRKVPANVLTKLELNDKASPTLQKLQAETSATEREFTSLKDIIKGTFVGSLLATGTNSIIGYLHGVAGEAIATSDAMYKFKQTMKLGGYGEEEIAKASKEVKKYANETVYDLSDITNTSAQLASNGIKGYQRLTEAAGNLNAQAGGNAETFKSVAMVMTQTAGAGKLTTENWNQLTDAIAGASGPLQKAMKDNGAYTGNFRDAMANGQITANEFFDAIEKLGTTKGAEEAAKSTETFEGAVGNLHAQVIQGLDDVIDKIGKKRITDMINTATDAVTVLTTDILTMFSAMAEHKNIAIGLGSILTGIFATKKIGDFIMWLDKAKNAMVSFGLVSQATNAATPRSAALPAAGPVIAGGSKLTGLATAAGRAVPLAAATYAVGSEIASKGSVSQKVGGSIGAIGGAVGGRALGGAIGTMIAPGIGTAVGQMLGGTLGTWAGNKLGDAIGKAANKKMQGHSIVAHAKVKIDADTSGSSNAVRPDLNKVARTVIKMSVDPKSIADTKQKTDKLYSDMSKSLEKYYSDKEKRSQKDLQELVKEGVLTQKQADSKLTAEKNADKRHIKEQQATISTMQRDTNNHYKRLESIENGGTKKLQQIAQKYGQNSKKYNQERIKELEKENKRYSNELVKDQMKNDRAIQASVKKGASQQEKIYKDLIKRKGTLSLQDLKQTQKDANKQYEATVKPAKKARDKVIKDANDRYKKTTDTARREWKKNGTISEKQYEEIKNNAEKQKDDTVKAAKDQYNGITKKASDQHKKVSDEIDRQKNDVIAAANGQSTGHVGASQTEMNGVNGNYSSGFSGAGKIWNKFLGAIKSVLKFFKQDTKNVPSVPTGYAIGTGALTENQIAMVGEEGPELAHTPKGYEMLGISGPEIRYLSAGTSILTHAQTKTAMALNGGKIPGYAKGTGAKIEDFVNDVKSDAEDVFDLLGKGVSEVWDWLKQKTGLDSLLGSQKSTGGIKRTTHGTFDYAKNSISNYIKKIADKFLESFSGGQGKMSKGAFAQAAKVAAALMHQSLSASDIERLYWQAMVESTVNPAQGGGIDDHDGTGRPIGLFQFKLGTWGAAVRHLPAGHSNIHSAVDQIMAVLADSTWRSDLAPIGVRRGWSPQGYANGGWSDEPAIFGEVKGEPELAINPARDSSEEHIAEAIEARAKVSPNGFAGNLSKIINEAKQSADNMLPFISTGNNHVQATSNNQQAQPRVDGNINITMNIDSKQLSRVMYPTMKAMRSHEVIINGVGGAVPVGNAQPLGGVY
ncbi:hypothetical protein DKZ23_03790 [Limosilactobacillus reuteri]|uniref:Tape measure protein N-terminal domain-containing protein n=1 Tax=Limosilactobacillus reuteri TaxID=1598 RepID=A0A317GH25_LIMRT|nr:tape measure protein [Limosilactobacillus reuteri]MCH5385317.1 tape measure protein [Limosilactobacillus reuteri]PWT47922.1 hypothetical protein DKZ23_03790 [Limosilactobacillus reuteri]PWT52266.1 hypothetical protein DKZ33_03840 [Limosilactobacillus reuteri]PWT63033.1 hypothetical protein DKZ32_03690 [Limosilactobacillus reuteri]